MLKTIKKCACLTLACALLLLSGCAKNEPAGSDTAMKTLAEIRAEKENISELAEKFGNLDLSDAEIYVPDVDALGGFTINVDLPVEEYREALYKAANAVVGQDPVEAEMRSLHIESVEFRPYTEIKDEFNTADYLDLQWKSPKIAMGVEFWGVLYLMFLDFDNVPISKIGNYKDLISLDAIATYDLLSGEPAGDVYTLQGGEISVNDAVEQMCAQYRAMPFYISELDVVPSFARVCELGESGDRHAISAYCLYEYGGVRLDHHSYSIDLEFPIDAEHYDYIRDDRTLRMSMARSTQIDQLSYAPIGKLAPTDESCGEFVSLESFLSAMSEKLTGNSKFKIDTVELLYGIDRVYPDGFDDLPQEKKSSTCPLGIKSRPLWVAYISHTGIQDAPTMCVWADALTGEMKLYRGQESGEIL